MNYFTDFSDEIYIKLPCYIFDNEYIFIQNKHHIKSNQWSISNFD